MCMLIWWHVCISGVQAQINRAMSPTKWIVPMKIKTTVLKICYANILNMQTLNMSSAFPKYSMHAFHTLYRQVCERGFFVSVTTRAKLCNSYNNCSIPNCLLY